jgi:phenylpropionate dioxygenase-like ring-hydroxylating dioxygenase large terminal subunit
VVAARRTVAHATAGTVPLVEDVLRVPVSDYTDEHRWHLEMDRIFRRLPLVLAFGCQVREPNSYVALDMLGVPVLVVRGGDGVLRGFVNTCSHRGAIVVEQGCGAARRFTCPYHAWSYDTAGQLVGILDRADFGEVDTAALGLTPLAVEERAGLVFGSITPGTELLLDEFLGGYESMLDTLGFADATYVGSQRVDGPNWKICYDGYLDFYHLPILHKATFGPTFNNKTVSDAWGPHQRNVQPDERWAALVDIPEDQWRTDKINGGVWTIFPHVSIAGFDAGGRLYMVSQLVPGGTPGTSHTVQHFLATFEPTDEQMVTIEKQMDFLLHVVRDEDYFTCDRIQQALRTGAKQEVLFGRNEGPGQRFHQWVDRLVAADTPEDTRALFAAAGQHHDT